MQAARVALARDAVKVVAIMEKEGGAVAVQEEMMAADDKASHRG